MRAENITDKTGLISSTQAEAVDNIKGADIFSVTPDVYKESKADLEPEVRRLESPAVASPGVARYIAQSPEHAAAATPDSDLFSWIEQQFTRVGQSMRERGEASKTVADHLVAQKNKIGSTVETRLGPQRQQYDLEWKKLTHKRTGEEMSEDEQLELEALRIDSDQNFGVPDYGITGPWETLPSAVASEVVDMGAEMWRNKETVGIITGSMIGLEAGAGALAGGPIGAAVGAGTGLLSGLSASYVTTSFTKSYRDTAGSINGTLERAKDDFGEPLKIDETQREYLAHGVGTVSALLSFGSDKLLLKSIPWLKAVLTPGKVAELVTKPANGAMREALTGIGKAMVINGTEESSQEVAQIIGEEIGQSYKESEFHFMDALERAYNKIENDPKTQERLATAARVGAATAGTFAAAGSTVQAGLRVAANQGEAGAVVVGDDDSDTPDDSSAVPVEPPAEPVAPVSPPSDINDPVATPDQLAVEVLEFQDVVEASVKVTDKTALKGLSPQEVKSIRKNIAEASGVKEVWVDVKEFLATFGNTDERAARVRERFDRSGVAVQNLNSPAKLPLHEFLELRDDYPEVSEYMQLHPEGPNPKSAKVYAAKKQEMRAKQAAFRERLALGEKSPEERAYAAKLMPEATDDQVSAALGTKEVADAYLGRLDVNEVAVRESTEGPQDNKNQKQLDDINTMRERVTRLRETLPDDVTAKQTLTEALNTAQPTNDIFGEEDYLEESDETKRMLAEIVPEKELENFSALERQGRQAVVDNIDESAEWEMNKVRDVYEEIATVAVDQAKTEAMNSDPNVAIVDKFYEKTPEFFVTRRYEQLSDLTDAQHERKKSYSPFAMDPRLLSEAQQKKYGKHGQLKKHRAFVKGGLSPDDAAEVLGVGNGDTLLRILATTPSREDLLEMNRQKRAKEIKQNADESVDLDHVAIAEAYHNRTRNNLQVMKYLIEKSWAKTAKIGERIALQVPRIDELIRQARNAILQTKVGDLNSKQFKVGERKSHKTAVKAYFKGDLLTAAVNKKAAALNSELTIAAMVATGKVNRAIKFLKRLQTKDIQAELKEAGPEYIGALQELLDVYKLSRSKKGDAERKSFDAWVQKQIALGNGDFNIPDRLNNVKESVNEMTVEELLVYTDRLRAILHTARRKNKLNNEYGDPAKELQTFEALKERLKQAAIKNIDFDENRTIPKPKDSLTETEKAVKVYQDLSASLTNMHFLLSQLDGDVVSGPFVEALWAPLKGHGKYAGGGEHGQAQDMIALFKQYTKIIDDFGKEGWDKLAEGDKDEWVKRAGNWGLSEWEAMVNQDVTVPEFENNPKLANGRMTKSQLLVMMMNRGNEENQQRMAENFGTDMKTIETVLDRELDERHAVLAQRIMDLFASYRERVANLEEDMSGVRPEMVEAVPYTHRGKVYPGGYFPIISQGELTYERIRRRDKQAIESATGERAFGLTADQFRGNDMTRHGHTKKRTGSDESISLSLDGIGMAFEMQLHDLNFRKPIADGMKILSDPEMAKLITAVLGVNDYNVIFNTYVDAASSVQMQNNALINSRKTRERYMAKIRSGSSVAYLVGNLYSLAMQITSSPMIVLRMGATGPKHILATLAKSGQSFLMGDMVSLYEFAADLLPTINANREGYDDNTKNLLDKKTPKRRFVHKSTAPIDKMLVTARELGFQPFAWIDNLLKAVTVVSGYSQFMQGDAPGFTHEQVMAMTPKERDHQARVYVTSLAGLTGTTGTMIDRAEVQKSHPTISQFYNDSRNVFNNILWSARRVRNHARRREFVMMVTTATTGFMTFMVMKAMQDAIKGKPVPWGEDNTAPDAAMEWLKYVMWAPADVFTDVIPLVRDVKFAAYLDEQWEKTVVAPSTPTMAALMHAKNAYHVGTNFMDVMSGNREVSRQENKSLWFLGSYAVGGLPVNTGFKIYDYLKESQLENNFQESTVPLADRFEDQLNDFKESQAELPKDEQVSEDIMKELENIKIDLDPTREGASIDDSLEDTMATIKQIESGGEWWAKNPNSSAAGLYQFTESTWDDIMTRAPELELTENGRVSAATSQQERAMEWFTKENAKALSRAALEPSIENLYTAHFLGAKKAVSVLSASDNIKLKSLISTDAMASNGFDDEMSVEDFKAWVTRKVTSVSIAANDEPKEV